MTSEGRGRVFSIFRILSRGIARIRGNAEVIEAFCLRCRVKSPMQKAETSIRKHGVVQAGLRRVLELRQDT